ncbi:uncharacterized [Tachysurus ichikawai]
MSGCVHYTFLLRKYANAWRTHWYLALQIRGGKLIVFHRLWEQTVVGDYLCFARWVVVVACGSKGMVERQMWIEKAG